MTDFGRRAGVGDMLTSVYDTDESGVVDKAPAHKDTHEDEGDDEISVVGLSGELADNQKSTWAKVSGKPETFTPSAHGDSHEAEGVDLLDVTGLVGTTPRAMLGDGTAGRVLRILKLRVNDGTNADTLKCRTYNQWNGDTIGLQDNIPKGASAGHFSLDIDGHNVTIRNTGLTGTVVCAIGHVIHNATLTEFIQTTHKSTSGIVVGVKGLSDGVFKDLTALVDNGYFDIQVLYITDA